MRILGQNGTRVISEETLKTLCKIYSKHNFPDMSHIKDEVNSLMMIDGGKE